MERKDGMRIRGKLICSFLIITLIPIILLCGTVGVMYWVQLETVEAMDGDTRDVDKMLFNPVQLMNKMTENIFVTIKEDSMNHVEKMEDNSYLEFYNEELEWKYSYLVVKKEEEYRYIGNEVKFKQVEKKLLSDMESTSLSESGTYIGGEEAFLVKHHKFTYEDGSAGTFFVITMVNGLLPGIKKMLVQFIVSFFIIICFTASLLTLWIYRGLVMPINVLKKATHRMRDGDLDFSIEADGQDEISVLCRDFEEMRIRLKESIEIRLGYEQEMRELVSNISHDLKTPLTAIEGYTEGIMDGVADTPEKQEKYLRVIQKKAKEMALLVDELSLSSKIENGTVPYNFCHVNVSDYFDDCVQALRLDLGIQKISVDYEKQVADDVRVEMDPEQLRRVINNIIGNSVKYLDTDKGKIWIRILDEEQLPKNIDFEQEKVLEKNSEGSRTGFGKKEKEEAKSMKGMIRVEFRDNGKGISEENLPHIFDRFYRADVARQSSTGGSGLGLAIARKIIEEHGGRIWAESKLGEGTSIFFTLCKEQVKIEQEDKDE